MKTIIVACGSGITTSTVATSKLKAGLEAKGLLDQVKFIQTSLAELPSIASNQDVIVTTAQGGEGYGIPVVSGLSLLTGMGAQATIDNVIEILGL